MFSTVQHRLKPLGALGMPPTGEVVQVGSVGGEQHGHDVVTLTVGRPHVAEPDYRAR